MATYNHVTILGNLTRDPEVRFTSGGTAVCDLGLALNDKRKNAQGEWVEKTSFVTVTCWGRTAEVAGEYLRKGAPCLIGGKLEEETWEQDGQKRSKLKVTADTLQLLGSKGGSERAEQREERKPRGSSKPAAPSNYSESVAAGNSGGGDSGGEEIPF